MTPVTVLPQSLSSFVHCVVRTTVARLVATAHERAAQRRSRRELLGLSEYELHDLGLSRADVCAWTERRRWLR